MIGNNIDNGTNDNDTNENDTNDNKDNNNNNNNVGDEQNFVTDLVLQWSPVQFFQHGV